MSESYRNAGDKSTHRYTFSQKWGDDPFTAMGHAQIPAALFLYGARLDIGPDEGYLICCILHFKRTPSDEGPNQEKLAELFGRSSETVRRLLRGLEKKNLLVVTHMRGELGYYTHSLYDWRKLRAALNECYWQDHPEERPHDWEPVAPLYVCLRESREPGYVYLLEGGGFHKIGKATNLDRRVQQIFPKLPFECRLLHAISSDDCLALEQWLHVRFAPQRCNGEWFQLEPAQVLWFLAQARLEAADLV